MSNRRGIFLKVTPEQAAVIRRDITDVPCARCEEPMTLQLLGDE
jgi:hypothetical protein